MKKTITHTQVPHNIHLGSCLLIAISVHPSYSTHLLHTSSSPLSCISYILESPHLSLALEEQDRERDLDLDLELE